MKICTSENTTKVCNIYRTITAREYKANGIEPVFQIRCIMEKVDNKLGIKRSRICSHKGASNTRTLLEYLFLVVWLCAIKASLFLCNVK